MSDAWEKYVADPRRVCKYGLKCYQKNEGHQLEFKHPPMNIRKRNKSPNPKRMKITPQNDVSVEKTKNHQVVSSVSGLNDQSKRSPELKTSTDNENKVPVRKLDIEVGKMHDVPDDLQTFIENLFLVKMPKDFFSLWEFCTTLNNNSPQDALKDIGVYLVGPYDVMAGILPKVQDKDLYLLNWRYYYDPPEFQTVLASKDKNGLHLGYFRDSPDDIPCFVASGTLNSCKIVPVAENIFGALNDFLETMKKKSPFKSILCHKLQAKLKSWTSDKFTLDTSTPNMKKRKVKVVAKTFHEAGIVVPVVKKTELGYRPLIESEDKIKAKLELLANSSSDVERDKAMSSLQEVITMANIATDECDFGTALELGIDFFSFGHPTLHLSAKTLLRTAYSMLNRNAFGKIISIHLANRSKGIDMGLNNL